ncbi:Cytosolic carboxypeptidase 6 [Collichthys lucidus]|uniref:Cytosolic carboxypeptidase 6 n=1 Tax=Collichthys lucidus TaxID=240159 RepID=A0A4V6ANY5_COLLU|nr:Cytosolic carboxypeptidase 6 [Collichthys lucidus]
MEESTVRDVDTGSEGGGEDALVGNVNKLTVSPPGYSGAPRRGHLVFDACFESGNLGRVDYISEFEFDLFIRPDTCNPRFRVWFNFTVENVRETQLSLANSQPEPGEWGTVKARDIGSEMAILKESVTEGEEDRQVSSEHQWMIVGLIIAGVVWPRACTADSWLVAVSQQDHTGPAYGRAC